VEIRKVLALSQHQLVNLSQSLYLHLYRLQSLYRHLYRHLYLFLRLFLRLSLYPLFLSLFLVFLGIALRTGFIHEAVYLRVLGSQPKRY
jgi:hypothetical protein